MPQVWLSGTVIGFMHSRSSQVSPGPTQMPQLGLQHRSPTLQVLGPQGWLSGTICMPHTVCEQRSPGAVHVPQLGLQQT
jgi:hypothetical protein